MRKKLLRFRENADNEYVIQPGHPFHANSRGRWHEHFGTPRPIVLEVGCGWGEYTTGFARLFPEKNFVGVDVKGARLWKGAKYARAQKMHNVRFLRTYAGRLNEHFLSGEISVIWLPFPDPFPGKRNKNRRLSAPHFIAMYCDLLQNQGELHLKTDDTCLFEEALAHLQTLPHAALRCATRNLYASPYLSWHRGVQTKYERNFLAEGKPIRYLSCCFLKED